MRIALEVWTSHYDRAEAVAVRAEALGLDGFYYGESPTGLNLECWTTLAGVARATERIRLGPVIANVLPGYRSVLLLAKQAATVAAIAGDRVDVRTGVGAARAAGLAWWRPFGIDYPDYDRRLADLTAAIDELPRLWSGRPVPVAGAADRGPTDGPVAVAEPAVASLPVTVAARGRRAMVLAATRAQGWETSFCTAEEFTARNALVSDLAAGRPVLRSLEIDGFVASSDAALGRLLDRVRTDRGADEDLEPILDRALLGTPDRVASRLSELSAAGVEQVVVALHDPTDLDALDALGEAARLVRVTTGSA